MRHRNMQNTRTPQLLPSHPAATSLATYNADPGMQKNTSPLLVPSSLSFLFCVILTIILYIPIHLDRHVVP